MKRKLFILVIGIMALLSIFLTSCKTKEFSVTLTETPGVIYGGFEGLSIEKGGELKFTITLAEGYNNSTVVVKVNGAVITPVGGVYTISDIAEIKTVTVEGVVPDTYTIALTPTANVTYGGYQSLTITEGGSFSFAVTLDEAYNNSTITVKANDTTLTAVEGVYTLNNITENQTITVEGVTSDTYTIALTPTANVTYGGYQSLTITEGGSFSFAVTLDEAYNNSTITVKANDTTLTAVGGVYTLNNITENQTITVEGVTSDTYTIALTPTTNVTYGGYQSLTITEGGSFSFAVTLDEAYNNSTITVKANATTLTAVGGVYTLNNITENQTITVEGVTSDTYTIALTPTANVTYGGYQSLTITEGGSFSFDVTLDEAYNNSTITVKANDITLTAVEGVYALNNITENQTITVEGVTEDRYTITLTLTEHVSYLLWDDTTVLEGGAFTFQVELEESYNNSEIIVKVNDVVLTADNGKYTITNITEDKTITVEGVIRNTYTVSLAQADGATYGGYESLTVLAGEDFCFTVTLDEGLAIYNNFGGVNANGISLTAISEGNYAIANVTADQTVTVSGIGTAGLGYNGHILSIGLNIESVIVPEGTTYIVGSAFTNFTNVVSISIPDSVTDIGLQAFVGTGWHKGLPDGVIYAGKVALGYNGVMPIDYEMNIIEGTLSIATGAFANLINLGKVTLPNSLIKINPSAFNHSNVTSINIPDGITRIYSDTFLNCARLTEVTFSENSRLDSIDYGAFYASGLTSFAIPGSVTEIDGSVFYGCSQLASVTIPENSELDYIGNYAFHNTPWLTSQPNGLLYIGNVLYCYVGILPENSEIELKSGTTMVCMYAFNNQQGLIAITLPDSLKYIGLFAFRDCEQLSTIAMPQSMVDIGEAAFAGCSSLTSIIIPDGIKEIPHGAFDSCIKLENIFLPASVEVIYELAFNNCIALQSITLPLGVNILEEAFLGCENLLSIEIPAGAIGVGQNAFENCSSLASVTLPDSLMFIGSGAFDSCFSLKEIIIPIGVEIMQDDVFLNCDALIIYCEAIQAGEGWDASWNGGMLVVWGYGLPEVLYSFETLFGGPVESISAVVLSDMPFLVDESNYFLGWYDNPERSGESLKSFYSASDATLYAKWSDAFPSTSGLVFEPTGETTCTLLSYNGSDDIVYIPEEYEGRAVTGIEWDAFQNARHISAVFLPDTIIELYDALCYQNNLSFVRLPANLETIGDYAFFGCSKLKSIYIPSSVTYIGEEAFSECYSLTKVVFGLGIEVPEILYGTFYYCRSLVSIDIPDGVISIGAVAFADCQSLNSISLPNSLEEIANSAFANCQSLVSLALPENLEHIGDYAFENCLSLSSIQIPSSVTYLGGGAFYSCASLKSVVFEEGTLLNNIRSETFADCRSLISITLPQGLSTIREFAFSDCASLAEIIIPESVTIIEYRAFYFCFNLTIYCHSYSPGEGWDSSWNYHRSPVVWGYEMPDITFSFDTNDGNTIASIVAPALFALPLPTKDGAYFLGWYDNDLFEGAPLSAPYYIAGSSAATLYAKWWDEDTYPEMVSSSFQYNLSEDKSYYIISAYNGTENIIYLPSSYDGKPVWVIGGGAFGSKDITAVYFGEGIKTISEFAFQDCRMLSYVLLSSSIETIKEGAFSFCESLTHIWIGSSVNEIRENAFEGSGITEINVHQDNAYYKSIDGVVFDKSAETLVQYPVGRTDTSYTIPDGVKTIGNCAFSFSRLETIIIPEGVEAIMDSAFYYSFLLNNVVLPSTLKTIEQYAFMECASLVSVVIPRSVTFIGQSAFSYCDYLESVYIPIEVSAIDYYAFNYSSKLTIYCESKSKPKGWASEWYEEIKRIIWGYTMPE